MKTRTSPCAGCGNTFEQPLNGGLRRWCADCVPSRVKWMREYRASAAPKPATKPYVCVDCGAAGEQYRQGRERLRCDPCGRAWQAKCDSQRTWSSRRMDPLPTRACGACGADYQPRRRDQRWCSRSCKDAHHGAAFRASGGRARLSPEARERQRLYWQEKNRRRRAAKRGGASEPYTLAEIAERDRSRCALCGGRVAMKQVVPHPKAPTIDHVVPVSEGGDDTRANVQLAHFRCNSVKGPRGSQQLALIG